MKVEIPIKDSETDKEYTFHVELVNEHCIEVQIRRKDSFYCASLGVEVFGGKGQIIVDDVDEEGNFGEPKQLVTLFEEKINEKTNSK